MAQYVLKFQWDIFGRSVHTSLWSTPIQYSFCGTLCCDTVNDIVCRSVHTSLWSTPIQYSFCGTLFCDTVNECSCCALEKHQTVFEL